MNHHGDHTDRWAVLTRAAFVLALALVIVRGTMLETLRDPFDVFPQPGTPAIPRGPGAAAGVVLDLLSCVPALLIFARRLLDRTYVLRVAASHLLLLLVLAAWLALSALWADDRFAAVVSASHWIGAAAIFWAMVQLVRSWLRLRQVAAVVFGLLLALLAQGYVYRFIEVPDLRASWQTHRAQILQDRGWEADSFSARQFEKRVLGGDMIGFSSSPNTYAAVVVLLATVGLGVLIQRWNDRDEPAWIVIPIVVLAAAAVAIYYTQSRAALLTPLIAAGILLGVRLLGGQLRRRPGLFYLIGAGAVIMIMALVVSYGLWRGTLFHDSLNFRWNYWVGAAKMFVRHPWLGVGFENFGQHYLAVRLPFAAEEIKDPHNFLVRFFVETGIIGGAVAIVWLLRLWWELTRPAQPPAAAPFLPSIGPGSGTVRRALGPLALAATVGIGLNIAASVDFTQPGVYVFLELLRRILFFCALIAGSAAVALHGLGRPQSDPRPAPWMLYGALAGLGVFLIHNLIDFSLFEIGPLYVFMLLAGAAAGARFPSLAGRTRRSGAAVAAASATLIAWIATAIMFVIPTVDAESLAQTGDDALRTGNAPAAAMKLRDAFFRQPLNADYAFRSARAMVMAAAPPDTVRAMLRLAIGHNPSAVSYYLSRANMELSLPNPDSGQIRTDYEQALALNPNEVSVRLAYAAVLEKLGDKKAALEQYRQALHYNNLLNPDEPKRLSEKELRAAQQRIETLTGELRL